MFIMTINNKSERNYRGKCLCWPVTSYGNDDTDEEDLVAIENEDMIHSLSEAVIDDMGVVNHPIIVDDTNISDLVCTGDLNQLKVSKLKEICLQGHLETPGHQKRRKTFVDPLVNYTKRCSCQEL